VKGVLFLAILVISNAHGAAGQESSLLRGQRIRVTAPALGLNAATGRFQPTRGDTLLLVRDSALKVPLAVVLRLEVSHGHSRLPVVVGAAAGAIAAGAVGFSLVDSATWNCQILDPCASTFWEDAFGPPAMGVAIGAIVGAAVGVVLRRERWDEIQLAGVRLAALKRRGGSWWCGLSFAF
jgi:hypothetical protein